MVCPQLPGPSLRIALQLLGCLAPGTTGPSTSGTLSGDCQPGTFPSVAVAFAMQVCQRHGTDQHPGSNWSVCLAFFHEQSRNLALPEPERSEWLGCYLGLLKAMARVVPQADCIRVLPDGADPLEAIGIARGQ